VHLAAVDRRAEAHALLVDAAHLGEAEHLEAARIGEDRALPVHEAVQPVVGVDHRRARAQHQVKRVAEDDARAEGFQLLRRHRLDRPVGAHGHEGRCLDLPAWQRHAAATGAALGAQQLEMQRHGRISMASP
jgi:hypothetical protein